MWFDFFNRPILGVFCLSSLIIYPQKNDEELGKIWKYLLTYTLALSNMDDSKKEDGIVELI